MSEYDNLVDELLSSTGATAASAGQASPARAAKAIDVGVDSGVPPELVEPSIEDTTKKLESEARSSLVETSPALQGWYLRNPIGARAAAGDEPQLIRIADKVNKVAGPVKTTEKAGGISAAESDFWTSLDEAAGEVFSPEVKRLWDGFKSGFGEGPVGFEPGGQAEQSLREAGIFGPGLVQQANEAIIRPAVAAGDFFFRLFGGATGVAAAAAGIGASQQIELKIGDTTLFKYEGNEAWGARAERDVKNFLDIAGMLLGVVAPYSVGPTPKVRLESTKVITDFDQAFNLIQQSELLKRSRLAFHDFIQMQTADAVVRVDANKILKLYEELGKVPGPEDGLFGYVPNISRKLFDTAAAGGELEIPMSSYMTYMDPMIHAKLFDDIRVGDALTAKEVLEPPPADMTLPEIVVKPEEVKAAEGRYDLELPPLKEGYVRFYHSGVEYKGGPRWLGTDPSYVNYREGSRKFYIDLPKDKLPEAAWDDINGFARNFEAPEELLGGLTEIKGAEPGIDVPAADTSIPKPVAKIEPPPTPEAAIETAAQKVVQDLYLNPLFKDAKSAGMTETEFKLYSKKLEDLIETERTRVREALAPIYRPEAVAAHKAAVEETLPWAYDKFDSRRDVTAEALIREGTPDGVSFKLNREIVESSGAKISERLTAADGLDPDEIAQVLGYNTGEELIADLAALHRERGNLSPAEYRAKAAKRLAEDEVVNSRGDVNSNIEKLLDEVVLSEPRTKLLYDDLRVMRLQNEGELSPPLAFDELSDWAVRVFGDFSVAEAKRGNKLFADVARAGRAAELALLKGKIVDAFKAKNQQLLATLLAKQATLFSREVKKALKLFERFTKKTSLKSVSQEYTDQVQRLLQRFGFPLKRKDNIPGPDLREFVLEKLAEGRELAVADWLYDALPRSVEELSVAEFRELRDAIESLAHNGRDEATILRGDQRVAKELLIKEIIDRVAELPPRFRETRGPRESARKTLREFDSLLTKPEEMFDYLDQRDPLGPMNESVFLPLIKAEQREVDLFEAASERLKGKKVDNPSKMVEAPWINDKTGKPFKLDKGDLVNIALNFGNKKNRELLLLTLKADEASITSFLGKHLTQNDWDYIENIWDFFRWLKPEVDRLYLRVTGVAPETVRELPFEAGGATRTGGYFPIIYDPVISRMKVHEAGPFENGYFMATTPNSYTKRRTQMFSPLLVERAYKVMPSKIRGMLHDLAFREPVLNAYKVLRDPEVRRAVNLHYGPEYGDKMIPWLKYVANHYNEEDRVLKWWSSLLRAARRNFVVQTLGFNASVILTPNLGPFLRDLGVHPIEAAKLLTPEHFKFALDNSKELQHRMLNVDRDVGDALRSMIGFASKGERFRAEAARFGMYLAVKMDTWLAMTAWNVVYAREYRAGASHADAVTIADKTVRKEFGSSSPVNLPQLMRSSESTKLLTLFYGYMNTMYNRARDVAILSNSGIKRVAKGEYAGARRDFAAALASTFAFVLVPAMFGAVYDPRLLGGEDDSWATSVGNLSGAYLLGLAPVFRDIGAYIFQGFTGRNAPITQMIINSSKSIEDLANAITGEEVSDKWLKHAIDTVGYAYGLPLGQFSKTTQFLWNMSTGDDDAETPGEWWNGLMRGESNPKR